MVNQAAYGKHVTDCFYGPFRAFSNFVTWLDTLR